LDCFSGHKIKGILRIAIMKKGLPDLPRRILSQEQKI
jgi:hypothetical protein